MNFKRTVILKLAAFIVALLQLWFLSYSSTLPSGKHETWLVIGSCIILVMCIVLIVIGEVVEVKDPNDILDDFECTCNQEPENCECHISQKDKHPGLYKMGKDLADAGYISNVVEDCPICGRDFDDIYDACSDCGFNPYSP